MIVSYMHVVGLQSRVPPPLNPRVWQVAPFRFVRSHDSVGAVITVSPQTAAAAVDGIVIEPVGPEPVMHSHLLGQWPFSQVA
jgi:hypothetical protein